MMRNGPYDLIVIGGGFYGCVVALELKKYVERVGLLEREEDLMQRASLNNQARIHQGYHYPRSILTSLRSRVNFSRFVEAYNECVYAQFDSYYAIGKILTKVSAAQFRLFCERIGAPIQTAPKDIKALFNPSLIEDVFAVCEYAFDAVKLKQVMARLLREAGVEIMLGTCVASVRRAGQAIELTCVQGNTEVQCSAKHVFNCTYSNLNQVLAASELPLVPLKHELTEIALVEVPPELEHLGITLMDGPFFSVMPFPARGLHSFSHVRYTPHHYWHDQDRSPYRDAYTSFRQAPPRSHYLHMRKDAQRYLPALEQCRYVDSLWEIKTLLPQSEIDDSRPILFRPGEELPNLISIMGGKIDNIFDIFEKITPLFDPTIHPRES